MSDLSFGKLIVPSLLTTGAVFTALSAPVVMFADTPLSIQQGNRIVYQGTVRNAALPYLALAGAASVSLGGAVVASVGWRKASKRANGLSETLEDQADRRAERQAYLEAALGSENYLKKSGLDFFLEDTAQTPFMPESMPWSQPLFAEFSELSVLTEAAAVKPIEASESVSFEPYPHRSSVVTAVTPEVPTARPVHRAPRTAELADQLAWLEGDDAPLTAEPLTAESLAAEPLTAEPLKNLPAPAPLPSAQGFYGFARGVAQPKTLRQSVAAAPAMTLQDQQTMAQINSLQDQLQAVVSQIDALRSQLPIQSPQLVNDPTAGIEVFSQLPDSQNGLVQQSFASDDDDRRSGEERRSEVGAVNFRRLAS